jgi:hypothetical protein
MGLRNGFEKKAYAVKRMITARDTPRDKSTAVPVYTVTVGNTDGEYVGMEVGESL